jgi:hypothetical protein
MFEHQSVLAQNTVIDVGDHLRRLGYVDFGETTEGFWAMRSWNRSWEMVLREIEC